MDYILDFHTRRFLDKPKISDLSHKQEESIYKLLGIDYDISERAEIRILDEVPEDELILVHYFNPEESVAHIRGVVIYLGEEEPRIIAESFPLTEEIPIEKDFDDFLKDEEENEGFEFNSDNFVFTLACEGTIVRVFQGPKTGEWYLSTHRKINGRRSRWSGPTFGQIFDEIWGSNKEKPYVDYMEKSDCYVFLISHPENKLVCDIKNPSMKLVGRFIPNKEGKMDAHLAGSEYLCFKNEDSGIEVQDSLSIKDKNEMAEKIKSINWKEYSGLFVYNKNTKKCYKFILLDYFNRRNIRGNEPNLKLRYLQFLLEPEEGQTTNQLRELFPEKCVIFDKLVSDYFDKIPLYIKYFYVRRYIKGDYSIIPQEEHFLVENVRKNYKKQFSLVENIKQELSKSSARQVNAIINHMLMK